MFILCRPYAGRASAGFWALTVLLFGGITTGVTEEKPALWHACFALMMISFVGAVVSSSVFYRGMRSHAARRDAEQSTGDVETVPLL